MEASAKDPIEGDGLTTLPSKYSVRQTMDRLVSIVESKGLVVFARIDHGTNAAQIDMPLRPTELLLFGHPRGGTPLMQDQQTVGIDLPVKALAWEDESGKVWLTCNKAAWLAERHRLSAATREAVAAVEAGMALVTKSATD